MRQSNTSTHNTTHMLLENLVENLILRRFRIQVDQCQWGTSKGNRDISRILNHSFCRGPLLWILPQKLSERHFLRFTATHHPQRTLTSVVLDLVEPLLVVVEWMRKGAPSLSLCGLELAPRPAFAFERSSCLIVIPLESSKPYHTQLKWHLLVK
ncbi:hypothetical protein DL96DRAFT_1627211 [Flagelloscypha sp. PMI_526]|nr:hypothetical protein DL96DRAFT_1627211 [Flagelloscypha sp. PMI_526]